VRDAIRRHRALAVVYVSYVAGWTAYGFVADRPGTIPYLLTMVALFVVLVALEARIRFSSSVLWIFCAWGFAHMAGGLVPVGSGVLYNTSFGVPLLRYDRVVHAVGFGTAAIACWQGLCSALGTRPDVGVGLAALVALMGMGVGAVNEVVEFWASHAFAANVGGYQNTGWDLVANLVGCSVAAAGLVLVSARGMREA
jgi:Predicted membrane protein (DUF2238)